MSAPSGPTAHAGPRYLFFVLLVSVTSAVVMGALVAASPGLLHVDLATSPAGLATLLGAVVLSGVVLWRSDFGLILLAGFVTLNLSQVLVRYHGLPSLLQLLVFPLLFGIWARRERADLARVAGATLTVPLVLYTLVLLFSTTLAREAELADERLIENLKALVVYFLVALLASSTVVIRRGVWTLLGAGALLAAIALVQVVTGNFVDEYGGLARIKHAQIYGEVFEERIAGPLGDPNFFAQILVMLVPLALFLAWSEKTLRGRILALGAAVLVTAAAVLTYSRGGAIALGCALLLSLVSRRIRLRHAVLGGGVIGLLLLLFAPTGFSRRLTTLEQVLPGGEQVIRPDSSFQKRRLLVGAAWRMFLDRPILGVGVGNYTAHFEEYADEVGFASRDYEEPGERHYPHNLYLEIGAETGLVGLLAFGAAVVASIASLRRARAGLREAGDETGAALAQGFEIALASYLVSSLFLHGHFQRYLWLLFGFSAAFAVLAARSREAPCREAPP